MKIKNIFNISLTILALMVSSVWSRGNVSELTYIGDNDLYRASDASGPARSVMNINNIQIWVDKKGFFPWDGTATGTAGEYPKGTAGLIFAEGMLWGAKVSDGNNSQRVRVNGSTYASGLKAGKVLYDINGNVIGSEDPTTRHIWRVRSNYKTADLSSDAAIFYVKDLSDVTGSDIQAIYDQYEYDWMNWPADDGAPFDDVDGDGVYDPDVDIPGYPGASQTIWLVANDIPYQVLDDGTACYENCTEWTAEVSTNSYGSSSIGIEMQLTMWAYDFASTNPLGNMLFKRARLTYTGLPGGPADARLDTVYFTQWSDPDLGTYTDDYVGCDVDLSLGFVYNGNTLDHEFNNNFGLPVPAGGYDFLQGPIVNGDTLGMTSFTYFGAGSSISDPDLEEYSGTLQFFNLMEGFLPRPEYPVQSPWVDPTTGEETKFVLSGDPLTGQGWIDGIQLPPGDRRMVMTTGPFSMELGDTQDVVLAMIGGMGSDNLSSVQVLKYYDTFAQFAYDQGFELPSPHPQPRVAAYGGDEYISLNWGFDIDYVNMVEDTIINGFAFEGYKVYQLPSASSAVTDGKLIANFDVVNDVIVINEWVVDPETGYVIDYPVHIGDNKGIQRFLMITRDELRNRPITNDRPYYFGVSTYSYLEDHEGAPFKSLESGLTVVTVYPQITNPESEVTENVNTTHVSGTAGGSVSVNIIDSNALTDSDYEVFFDQQHYYRDIDGIWQTTNYPDSVGRVSGFLDCSGSSITGAAIASEDVGTIDLTFTFDMVCGDNWVDGIVIDLPDDIVVNSWEPVIGCDYPDYGQNCDNMNGTIDANNTITWGNNIQSTFGAIQGSQVLKVNVQPFTFPVSIDYIIYDDGYDGTVQDATGSLAIDELGYEFKTIKHWNLKNLTTSEILLEDQFVMGGYTLEYIENGVYYEGGVYVGLDRPIIEGFMIDVDVNYSAPSDFESYSVSGTGSYEIDSYLANGWAASAMAIDTWGSGTQSVDLLQRDIQIRFTGEYDTPVEVGGVTYHPIKEGTGSMAWIDGARDYDLALHPDPNNPGDGSPFKIRVPFEVWDMEAEGGPRQIDITIYDRKQDVAAGGDFYAFNPNDRMYCHFIHKDHDISQADTQIDESVLTWNTVWWKANWATGDIVNIVYGNPIQLGVDVWTFSTNAPRASSITDEEVDMINVFPNPYYGFHELESSRSGKYVTFNHLPQRAEVRIFNMGGVMVRKLTKDDPDQYLQWDLKNQAGYPVASGIYIAHIKLPDAGKNKILKIALVQEEQILQNY